MESQKSSRIKESHNCVATDGRIEQNPRKYHRFFFPECSDGGSFERSTKFVPKGNQPIDHSLGQEMQLQSMY
jgi:hypothetical protein